MTSRVFFALESLSSIHYLYQYSLQHYMDTVLEILHRNESVNAIPRNDPQRRLQVITRELFIRVNNQIGHGLLEEHKMIFTLRLAQIRLGEDRASEDLFDVFWQSTNMVEP